MKIPISASKETPKRTRSVMIANSLSNNLEAQTFQIKEIEAGLAEADAGDFATDAQVNAVFANYGA